MVTSQLNNSLSFIWNKNLDSKSEFDFQEIDNLFLGKLLKLFQLGDSYFFIANMPESCFEYLSPEVEQVLGYRPDEMTMELGFSKVHPDDRKYMVNVEHTIFNFYGSLSIEKIFKYIVRYDYRIQRSNGSYARILHQAMMISHAENGTPIKALAVQTDISFLKTISHPCLSFISLDGGPDFIDIPIVDFEHPQHKKFFSKRESEILALLWEGKESSVIAQKLSISKNTVDTHRRRMLERSGSRNTIELIKHALSLGEI